MFRWNQGRRWLLTSGRRRRRWKRVCERRESELRRREGLSEDKSIVRAMLGEYFGYVNISIPKKKRSSDQNILII
jgi:hypothetical protein